MLQKYPTYHFSWGLQGFINKPWINKVDKHQGLEFREKAKDQKETENIILALIILPADLAVFHGVIFAEFTLSNLTAYFLCTLPCANLLLSLIRYLFDLHIFFLGYLSLFFLFRTNEMLGLPFTI